MTRVATDFTYLPDVVYFSNYDNTACDTFPMTAPGRTLLACWLTAVLTGTVVDHRHVAAAGHTHGFGWAALHDCSAPAGTPFAHRHFVLLGIEFGAVPADGGSVEGARSAAEVVASDDARMPDTVPDHPPPAHIGLVPLTAAPGVNPVASVPHTLHCPLVSRARTGVLRS